MLLFDFSDTCCHLLVHPPVPASQHISRLTAVGSCLVPGLFGLVVAVAMDGDQLRLQGGLALWHLSAVVLRQLEAHEDGGDGLGGVHAVEDGVGRVLCIQRGGRSVRVGGATVDGRGCASVWAEAEELVLVHTDVVAERNITGWGVAQLWLLGRQHLRALPSRKRPAIGSAPADTVFGVAGSPIFQNTVFLLV